MTSSSVSVVKRCSVCSQEKPLDDFPFHANSRNGVILWRGWRKQCRSCFAEIAAARFQKQKEVYRPARERWYANNLTAADFGRARTRARKFGATQFMTKAEWTAMRSTTVCHWCSCSLHPSFTTIEHIMPLIEGGQHTFGNVVQACWNCNLQREWERKVKYPRDLPQEKAP